MAKGQIWESIERRPSSAQHPGLGQDPAIIITVGEEGHSSQTTTLGSLARLMKCSWGLSCIKCTFVWFGIFFSELRPQNPGEVYEHLPNRLARGVSTPWHTPVPSVCPLKHVVVCLMATSRSKKLAHEQRALCLVDSVTPGRGLSRVEHSGEGGQGGLPSPPTA